MTLAAADPESAAASCFQIRDESARSECAWTIAEGAAAEQPLIAEQICDPLAAGFLEECLFRVAVVARKVSLCQRTGEHAARCRNHIAHELLDTFEGDDRLPGRFELIVADALAPHALAPMDWPDMYLHAMRRVPDLSLALCEQAVEPLSCAKAVRVAFVDKLEAVIRNGELACTGETPGMLNRIEDAELDAMVAQARAEGRCVP